MKAKDVMTTEVICAGPEISVRTIARTLLKHRISAVPVIDDGGRLIGIVSEGDLMRRPESETEQPRSWWLKLIESPEDRASQYLKSHGLTARDVMTREPVSVTGYRYCATASSSASCPARICCMGWSPAPVRL